MLRSLVGSEMCIRDSINAEYGEPSLWYGMSTGHTRPRRSPFDCRLPPSILECGVFSADCPLRGYKRLRMGKQRRLGCGEHRLLWMARSDVYVRPRHSPVTPSTPHRAPTELVGSLSNNRLTGTIASDVACLAALQFLQPLDAALSPLSLC
eukprot:TRINITY_DN8148_c0_g2_i2.p1 TRINITY_DN8148_c0_g2~~TRINITY_DN8148_c0_g2_i2.p1  ORF type:complete len:151 (-),score=20.74 TRINITY_DN8148_c0_g2_i2:463-915(-)